MKAIRFFSLLLMGALFCACNKQNEPEPIDTGGYDYPDAPEGAIPGVFSVSDSTQVYFSQGNLQYKTATQEFCFADHQYDVIGDVNGSKVLYKGRMDLFGWGTGDCPTKTVDDNSYSSFVDWGTNAITNGGNEPGLWRTLTNAEWNYLLESRPDAKSLYGSAQVDDVNGAIILPDNWTAPSNVTFVPGMNGWTQNVYDAFDLALMEENGAVFLPVGGFRQGEEYYLVQLYGFYWSATPFDGIENNACDLSLSGDNIGVDNNIRANGLSVRLVQDVH